MFGMNVRLILLTIPVCLTLDNRIINGEDSIVNEYPYAVAIYWKSRPSAKDNLICGGVIMAKNWILTSAQCIRRYGSVTIKAGNRRLSSCDENEQYRQVSMQIAHGGYRRPNPIAKNDIALFKLNQKLHMNDAIRSIHLPAADKDVKGHATVIGWGGDNSSNNSDILQAIVQPIIQAPYCQDILRTISSLQTAKVDDDQVCTGKIGEKESACGKDRGGPLVQGDRGSDQLLVGIVSWSDSKCGQRGLPTVYTKVSSYIPWIQAFIKN